MFLGGRCNTKVQGMYTTAGFITSRAEDVAVTEHHGTEAGARDLKPGRSEIDVLHWYPWMVLLPLLRNFSFGAIP